MSSVGPVPPPSEVSAEAASLRALIRQANRAYYERDAPELTDAEYDRMFRRLQALEREYPDVATADSPTRRVGGAPATHLPKHQHRRPMLSLANAFSDDELRAWEQRNARLVPGVAHAGYTIEVKIDGTAVSLTYVDGVLVTGASRGNGRVGENVTANLRTIDDIPLALRMAGGGSGGGAPRIAGGGPWPRVMEVRGEVYFPREAFRKLNLRREQEGETPFANPRNAAAGGLRQLDPATTRSRRLRCYVFQIVPIEGEFADRSHHEMLRTLQQWGFQTEPHSTSVPDLETAIGRVAELEQELPTLPFAADGVVIKVDSRAIQDELGTISDREPRWAIARKFAPEVGITQLLDIRVSVGRTGALVPYAVLEPVELAGVTISTATLHNEDLVAAKDLRVGDWVEVIRAGEVIPGVVGPILARRTGHERTWAPPEACPVCGTATTRDEEEAARYCPNPSCPARIVEGIVHFASRDAMDIRGLGEERVRQLRDAGLITNFADLYRLTAAQLTLLPRFAQKSAALLVEAIANSRSRPLSRLLYGLGIRHVGRTVARALAEHFVQLDRLRRADETEIAAVPGVGATIALAVREWLDTSASAAVLEQLIGRGVTLDEPVIAVGGGGAGGGGVLADQTWVLTGTLPTLSRSEATHLIQQAGGTVASSVSVRTTTVLAGTDAGSKLERARKLGVEIVDEGELLRRIGSAP